MTENVSLFEETRKETNIDGEALWLIGVDTPKGIHCCNGGCSMGSLDLGMYVTDEEIWNMIKEEFEKAGVN